MITWILTGIALLGWILNIKRKRICWLFLEISAIGFLMINYLQHDYGQATLWLIYCFLGVYGYFQWGPEGKI